MKIKFTKQYEPKDNSGVVYDVGDVRDFTPASALHFMNRGVAIEVKRGRPGPKAGHTKETQEIVNDALRGKTLPKAD